MSLLLQAGCSLVTEELSVAALLSLTDLSCKAILRQAFKQDKIYGLYYQWHSVDFFSSQQRRPIAIQITDLEEIPRHEIKVFTQSNSGTDSETDRQDRKALEEAFADAAAQAGNKQVVFPLVWPELQQEILQQSFSRWISQHLLDGDSSVKTPFQRVLRAPVTQVLSSFAESSTFERFRNPATGEWGWKDNSPKGLAWYSFVAYGLTQVQALKFCADRSLKLPQEKDYEEAARHGLLDIFPMMKQRWLWSSTPAQGDSDVGIYFNVAAGHMGIDYTDFSDAPHAAICTSP